MMPCQDPQKKQTARFCCKNNRLSITASQTLHCMVISYPEKEETSLNQQKTIYEQRVDTGDAALLGRGKGTGWVVCGWGGMNRFEMRTGKHVGHLPKDIPFLMSLVFRHRGFVYRAKACTTCRYWDQLKRYSTFTTRRLLSQVKGTLRKYRVACMCFHAITVLVLLTPLNCYMFTLCLVYYALFLTPACWKFNNANATHGFYFGPRICSSLSQDLRRCWTQ